MNPFTVNFFRWFNGLEVLHCVHFLQGAYYADEPVRIAAWNLLEKQGRKDVPENEKELLLLYRNIQRGASPTSA